MSLLSLQPGIPDEKEYTLTTPLSTRILFVAFTLIIIAVWLIPEPEWSWPAFAITMVLAGGTGYREKWTFDKAQQKLIVQTGIYLFLNRKEYPFNQIINLRFTENAFDKKSDQENTIRELIRQPRGQFVIELDSGKSLIIDERKGHARRKLKETTLAIAEWANLPCEN